MASNYQASRAYKSYGKLTPEKKAEFLEKLKTGISIAGAARAVGVTHSTVYNLMNRDKEFKTLVSEAREAGSDRLEDTLLNIGVRDRNVTSLIFLLKGRRPEIYREKYQADITNSDGSFAGLFAEVATLNDNPEQSGSNETDE